MIKKVNKNIEASKVAKMALDRSVETGTTNPSVQILTLRNLPDGASKKEEPNPSELAYGQLSINYTSSKEKIFFKNNAGILAVFDTSKNILTKVDEADLKLQQQIDIINGNDSIVGSFAHADKVLEDKLVPQINQRVLSVTGEQGVIATTDLSNNVTLKGVVKSDDKILGVNNSGFTATVYATYDWDSGTVKLFGKDPNTPLSTFNIQTGEKLIKAEPHIGTGAEHPIPLIQGDVYLKYTFGTNGVEHETIYCHLTPILPLYKGKETDSTIVTIEKDGITNFNVSTDVKISKEVSADGEQNTIKVNKDGLFVGDLYDGGKYTAIGRDNAVKLQLLRSIVQDERPLPSSLKDGELAVNTHDGLERIFLKNSSGTDVAIFDTSKNILTIVDDKIATEIGKVTDPNATNSLQWQINQEIIRAKAAEQLNTDKITIINGDEGLEGSFTHADKVLKDELLKLIDTITGGTGATVVIYGGSTNTINVDYDVNTKTVTANARISTAPGNKIVANNDGLYVTTPEIDITGGTTNSIVTNFDKDTQIITSDIKVSNEAENKLELKNDGLYVNITEVNLTGGETKTAEVLYDTNTQTVSTNIKVSAENNNKIEIKDDGLFIDRTVNGGSF